MPESTTKPQSAPYYIEQLTSSARIRECAVMMAGSNPWSVLSFSVPQCEQMLNEDTITCYGVIAESGQELCGLLATAAAGLGGEPLLEYLCVAEAHRNAGIGTSLISFYEQELFPAADNVYLFVSDINPHAIRLYERLGYRRIGVLPDFNLTDQTEYLYRKTRRPRQQRVREASSSLHPESCA